MEGGDTRRRTGDPSARRRDGAGGAGTAPTDEPDRAAPAPVKPACSGLDGAPPIGVLDALIFAALLLFALVYPHAGFDGVVPDNIAQAAYFSLLGRPELVGSIGSSVPKGGLILILGLSHHLCFDLLGMPGSFTLLPCGLFAAGIWMVARIATDLGGRAAGALALVVVLGLPLPTTAFVAVSSNLFFMPFTLLGLWLVARGRDHAGVAALALASTIRPEGLLVLASVALFRALGPRDWRRLAWFTACGIAALAVYVLLARWVQGSWERIGAGPATGYPVFEGFRTLGQLRETLGMLLGGRLVALLVLPAVYLLVVRPASRAYLHFLPMVLAFAVLVWTGHVGVHYRFIASIETLIVALGCAALFLARGRLRAGSGASRAGRARSAGLLAALVLLVLGWWSTGNPRTPAMMLAIPAVYALAVAASRTGARLAPAVLGGVAVLLAVAAGLAAWGIRGDLRLAAATPQPSVQDGREFLEAPVVPAGATVITEDELLNYVLVTQPDFLRGAHSLQSFNVADAARRREMLAGVEYLYVSKRENRGWNYLFYFPRAEWTQDPFRLAVTRLLRTNGEALILGARLTVVYHSPTRLVARITPG